MKNIIVALFSLLFSIFANAELSRTYVGTTWLKSTGGAGVASVLMDEATILNPAPLAFYQMSSIYFQKSQANYISEDAARNNTDQGDTLAIISDSKGKVGGSVSYQKSQHLEDSYQRIGVALATTVKDSTSVGISYSDTSEKEPLKTEKYKQINAGVTHVLNASTTLGVLFTDLQRNRDADSKALVGIQYVFNNFISLMVDFGGDYQKQLSEYYVYKTAVQFRIMDDFYLRLGRSEDFTISKRITGVGAGWISPKMVINASYSDVKDMMPGKDDVKETGFSVALKF
jgi:hypothetical protein